MITPKTFSINKKPRPIYLKQDIIDFLSEYKLSKEEIDQKLFNEWINNDDLIVVDVIEISNTNKIIEDLDLDSIYSKIDEIEKIEKILKNDNIDNLTV